MAVFFFSCCPVLYPCVDVLVDDLSALPLNDRPLAAGCVCLAPTLGAFTRSLRLVKTHPADSLSDVNNISIGKRTQMAAS